MRNYSLPPLCCCVSPERVVVKTAPGNPAVALETVKAHLNIPLVVTQFDTIIELYINAATISIQEYTCFTLVETEYEAFYNCFPPCILLKDRPNVSVSEILYTDIDDVSTVLDSAEYNIFTDEYESKIQPETSWPDTAQKTPDAVKITYTSGFGTDTTDVPPDFQLAICQVVAAMYANKGDCGEDCVEVICLGIKTIASRLDYRASGGCL